MKKALLGCGLLALLCLSGCETVPMTYEEWKEEQERRRTATQTGIPFKSKREVKAEGEELKKIGAETKFP